MYKKICFTCHKSSYSSSNRGSWICPYCGSDLTAQRALDAMVQKQINQPIHLKKKAVSAYENSMFLNRIGKEVDG